MEKKDNTQHIDYDTHWKEIIKEQFEDFILFFLPTAHKMIDFQKPIEFLEQELHKIVADRIKEGKVINDKLVKVHLKNGQEKWILIHIEIQSSFESDFSRRMFIYFYRIFDRYEQKVTALAIYTGEKVSSQYDKFSYDFLGTSLNYQFNSYQVRKAKEKELLASKNPFALVVLATKYLHESKTDKHKRFQFKRKLIKLAKERGYSGKQIISLLKFIDLILVLPVDLEQQFVQEVISTFIKTKDMETLKSDYFSNQLHLALYGETFEERLNREMITEKVSAVEGLLQKTDLSLESIAKILKLSVETVIAIKSKMR